MKNDAQSALKFLLLAGIPCVWLIVIFLLSNDPNSSHISGAIVGGANNMLARKIAHVIEYALLFVLIKNPLALVQFATRSSLVRSKHHEWKAFAAVVVFACLDEWHQSFVPGRCATVTDVFIDSAGALIGWIGSNYVEKLLLSEKRTVESLVKQRIGF